MAAPPLPVVILISGRGSNMLAIAQAAQSGRLPARIAAVISDRPEAPGLLSAKALGLRCEVVAGRDYSDRSAYDTALAAMIGSHSPALVVLAGFMRILTPAFVEEFAGRLLNIHPSLLPAYPGLRTHARIIAAG